MATKLKPKHAAAPRKRTSQPTKKRSKPASASAAAIKAEMTTQRAELAALRELIEKHVKDPSITATLDRMVASVNRIVPPVAE